MGEIRETGVPGWQTATRVRRIKLQVVPDADRRPTLSKDDAGDVSPFMSGKGDGGVELLCGGCDHLLADHIYPADELAGNVLSCPVCGAHNLA